jgi:hypothetical protein
MTVETAVRQTILDFYTSPQAMTSVGDYAAPLESLPAEVGALVEAVQGMLLHEHLAGHLYSITLSDEQHRESHIRPAREQLKRIVARGWRPGAPLPREQRLIGTCRDFSVLLAALLRLKGIPARARCGFGAYFTPGFFEDHWVSEYWDSAAARWVRVEAQLDSVQQGVFKPDFDLLDVPHDRFVIAGDAWEWCRAGKADPAKFGMSGMNESGLWWIAGNLVRDLAALNNMEMLPWDCWGAMPRPDETIEPELLALFDRAAALTCAPEDSFAQLRACYEEDQRFRVPATVFNAVLRCEEPV